MGRKHIFVGMDVHKETTVIALAHGGRSGKVESFGTYATSIDSFKIALSRLKKKKNAKLHFVYESGPTGFVLQRRLQASGEDCIVVSASHVPKRWEDRVKTDRHDAALLAKMHRSGELEPIHVPDSEYASISWNAARLSTRWLIACSSEPGSSCSCRLTVTIRS